jgi:hypothetical protein
MGVDAELPDPPFLTIADAAQCLSMKPATIARMVAAGSLVGYVYWPDVEAKLIPTRPRRL